MIRSLPVVAVATMLVLAVNAHASGGTEIHFACDDGVRISVLFVEDRAVLSHGDTKAALTRVPVGSGFAYVGTGHVLRGKGEEMTWTDDAGSRRVCRVGDDAPATR